jgi:hypothetical protein
VAKYGRALKDAATLDNPISRNARSSKSGRRSPRGGTAASTPGRRQGRFRTVEAHGLRSRTEVIRQKWTDLIEAASRSGNLSAVGTLRHGTDAEIGH